MQEWCKIANSLR